MNVLSGIIAKASANRKHIILAEGLEPRIVAGAVRAAKDGVANITLLGPKDQVRDLTRNAGDSGHLIDIINPETSEYVAELVAAFRAINSKKTLSDAAALEAIRSSLNFANMYVRTGRCDGSLAGAEHASADVLRSAIAAIGLHESADIISSFFVMVMPEAHTLSQKTLIFSDCACVVSPTAEQLASIAASTVNSAKRLLGLDPKVALLSFSTRGSAQHPAVQKVEEAGQILSAAHPSLPLEIAIQFDAAIIDSVAKIKAPNSPVAGQANILIFPTLDAGNIGYKIAQRLGGAKAIGPIFQGLARPANDLSRGCSADDVYNMIAVTAVQAQNTDAQS